MKQVLLRNGNIIIDDVPYGLSNQMKLVCAYYSYVSVGTEISGLKTTEESLRKH